MVLESVSMYADLFKFLFYIRVYLINNIVIV